MAHREFATGRFDHQLGEAGLRPWGEGSQQGRAGLRRQDQEPHQGRQDAGTEEEPREAESSQVGNLLAVGYLSRALAQGARQF